MGWSALQRNAMLDTLDGCWISLHTDDPGLNGANEVSGNGYGRQAENLGPAASGNKQNIANIDFAAMPSVVVQYYGTWDAPTGGNFLAGCALIEPKTLNLNDTFRFEPGKLRFTLY